MTNGDFLFHYVDVRVVVVIVFVPVIVLGGKRTCHSEPRRRHKRENRISNFQTEIIKIINLLFSSCCVRWFEWRGQGLLLDELGSPRTDEWAVTCCKFIRMQIDSITRWMIDDDDDDDDGGWLCWLCVRRVSSACGGQSLWRRLSKSGNRRFSSWPNFTGELIPFQFEAKTVSNYHRHSKRRKKNEIKIDGNQPSQIPENCKQFNVIAAWRPLNANNRLNIYQQSESENGTFAREKHRWKCFVSFFGVD